MNIFKAAKNGNNKRIKELLKSGTDVKSKDNYGDTALIWASLYSDDTSSIETVKLLLDHGADVNAKNNDSWTALMVASINSNSTSSIETVKLLLDHGADVNSKDNSGYTALMWASLNSNDTSSIETVKLLLDHGADVNAINSNKETALMMASMFSSDTSSIETVKLLLDYGADPFISRQNKDALDYCPTKECKQVIAKNIWERFKKTDNLYIKNLNKNIFLSKDVWELIILNKRQKELCRKLSDQRNKYVLIEFALDMNIPNADKLTKAQICGLISRQLAFGKYYNGKTQTKINKDRMKIIEIAMTFGLDVDRPINKILEDLSKLF